MQVGRALRFEFLSLARLCKSFIVLCPCDYVSLEIPRSVLTAVWLAWQSTDMHRVRPAMSGERPSTHAARASALVAAIFCVAALLSHSVIPSFLPCCTPKVQGCMYWAVSTWVVVAVRVEHELEWGVCCRVFAST
jgi:hypothetical protein